MAEFAYRKYLRGLFSSFDQDKIQYAELRPNFMAANSVSFIIFLGIPIRPSGAALLNKLAVQQVIHTSKSYRNPIKKNGKDTGEFAYDPTKTMVNEAIMKMIIDEFKDWQGKHPKATFKSMKVIMCTPRARGYKTEWIEKTMQECLDMKRKSDYKPWIAGKLNNYLVLTKQASNTSQPINGMELTPLKASTSSAPSLRAAPSKNSGPSLPSSGKITRTPS